LLTAADGPLLSVFAAVVRRSSFTGAAEELKLSKSVVSERIKQLEERCGSRLLDRTTRQVHLTASGAEVLAAAARVEEDLRSARAQASTSAGASRRGCCGSRPPATSARRSSAQSWRAAWRPILVTTSTMRFLGPGGAKEELVPNVRAEANSGATVLGLLLHGAGVGVLPEHMLRDHLHAGRLVRVCPAWIWKRVTLYALMPAKPAPGSALKAFLTLLVAEVERDRIRWATPAGEPS
jgi:DNA-binding transcriptional LysR family regulator